MLRWLTTSALFLATGACSNSGVATGGVADTLTANGATADGAVTTSDLGVDVGDDGAIEDVVDGADTTNIGTDTSDIVPAPFACGPSLTCETDQACAGTGQGMCGGPAPNAAGHCAPGCSAMDCGGSMHCLCTFYECVDLPVGCRNCTCAKTPGHESCPCDDAAAHVELNCPGA